MTRAQMASFLVRAFRLGDAAAVSGFVDTAGSVHEASIDGLAAAGITTGCATEPVRFCPDDDVTRAQMATFLARATGLVPLPDRVEPPLDGYMALSATRRFLTVRWWEDTASCLSQRAC